MSSTVALAFLILRFSVCDCIGATVVKPEVISLPWPHSPVSGLWCLMVLCCYRDRGGDRCGGGGYLDLNVVLNWALS